MTLLKLIRGWFSFLVGDILEILFVMQEVIERFG